MIVALLCSDVGPGDQVIVPSLTMVAVANGVKLCGATPVYADNAPNMLNPSWEEIEAKATSTSKQCGLDGSQTTSPISASDAQHERHNSSITAIGCTKSS